MPRRRNNSQRSTDLLLEIGTEELPAAYLTSAIAQLREDAERLCREAHLEFARVETYGTPRRLILVVRALSSLQRNPPEEIRGPSKQAAFDSGGKPTSALQGFLRAKGGQLNHTKIVSTEKGAYVYLLKPARDTATAIILPALIETLIMRLRFPKTMRWDASGVRFARPIRWLLALYGRAPVRGALGSLTGGRRTWVGGPKRPRAVTVADASRYFAILKQQGIVWDPTTRRRTIEQLVTKAAAHVKGRPAAEMISHGLLDEVTFLVEQPVPLAGQFDAKYLGLPREVLLASMAKHQRVFALQARSGKLLPAFVAILNGKPRKLDQMRKVHEHILNARLADSLLFWEQDRKVPFGKEKNLSSVTFHEKLGSMEEKTQRLFKLAPVLAEAWNLSTEDQSRLERACLLAKHDLVTTMVKEFPTLQGVMGRYYARASGEPEPVARAIGEQYLPLAGVLPKTLLGSALSILDKFDTLAAYFSIDIEPTGDQDPFGLRRAAQGIVETAWVIHRPLPLSRLLAAHPLIKQGSRPATRIKQYLLERLYTFAWPPPAPGRDLIDAVLGSPCDDPVDAMDRIRHLQQLNGNRTLLKAAKVVERTHNILKGVSTPPPDAVDPSRFQEPLEHELWTRYSAHRDQIAHLIDEKAYGEATKAYGEAFFETLHQFFATVMVNVEDGAVQRNRLALMRIINALYTDRIADLSKLTILQREDLPTT